MLNTANYLKAFIGACLVLLQASSIWCDDLSASVVKLYLDLEYICAGTLVKDNFVVTLADCFQQRRSVSPFFVVANVTESEGGFSIVDQVFIPPSYKARYMDVAVLKLKTPLVGPNIKPANLCSKNRIEYKESVMLYYWDSIHKYMHIVDDLDLKTVKLSVSNNGIWIKNDLVFCAADPENTLRFRDRGGPAAIDGEFCGIYKYGACYIKNSEPGYFTSLANAQVMKFITESLEK